MYYWNKANFEGLASLGEACARVANLELFSRYCFLREKGLRKQALEAAASFAKFVVTLRPDAQREISTRLVELQYANPDIHQLLPHPVKLALIDISEKWAGAAPDNADPLVHLGLLTGEIAYFQSATRLRPADQVALKRLACHYLDFVSYQAHHLSESRFIGSIEEAQESLRDAEELIGRISDDAVRQPLQQELEDLALLVSEWIAYCKESPIESFPDWTGARRHSFDLPSIVYYR